MKFVTLPDFLTDAQINECMMLFPDQKAIRDQIIVPNLSAINRKLGQENDANFLAYAVVYVLTAAADGKAAKAVDKETN